MAAKRAAVRSLKRWFPGEILKKLWKNLSNWLIPNLGDRGERAAERYLRGQGFKIKARKFAVRGGEADLVAEKGGVTVIVEVKTRASRSFGSAVEAVTPRKIRRLKKAAVAYCRANEISLSRMRIDVIAIEKEGSGTSLRHYVAAVEGPFSR